MVSLYTWSSLSRREKTRIFLPWVNQNQKKEKNYQRRTVFPFEWNRYINCRGIKEASKSLSNAFKEVPFFHSLSLSFLWLANRTDHWGGAILMMHMCWLNDAFSWTSWYINQSSLCISETIHPINRSFNPLQHTGSSKKRPLQKKCTIFTGI